MAVSPYIDLPTAPTLPYSYRPLPHALPLPTSTADAVLDIAEACKSIKGRILEEHEACRHRLAVWQDTLKQQELAEKRRIAPGWLDRNEKILLPFTTQKTNIVTSVHCEDQPNIAVNPGEAETQGDALDRAFGSVKGD